MEKQSVLEPKVESLNLTSIDFTPLTAQKDLKKIVTSKIQEDVFRFRTCCADPRASK